ncbi:MAG: hypothetical protein Q9171_000359 [Xanthocarpia ochracea]
MEEDESARQKEGNQVASPVRADGPAIDVADQLATPAEPNSSGNKKEEAREEANGHDKVSVDESTAQLTHRSSTGAPTEARGSPKDREAHEQAASEEPNGSAQETEVVEDAQPTKRPTPEICAHCLGYARVKCAQCGSTWYCSRECQRADWTYHKYLCREYKDFQNRPDPDSVRALLFPENEKAPRFVWLKQNEEPLDLGRVDEKFETEEVEQLLGVTEDEIGQQYVTRSIRRDRRADKITARVYLLLRQKSFTDGSKPNMSIGWVTKGNFHFSWRGPVIAVSTRFDESEENDEEPVVEDLSMVDFRDMIDFFGLYGQWLSGCEDFGAFSFWWMPQSLRDELEQQHQIQGVTIASDVELRHTGIKYQEFYIGEGHPAMAFLQPCAVSCRLGLPLVVRRRPADDEWQEEAQAESNLNHGAHMLLLDIEPKSRAWGTAPLFGEQGTVLLMRQDRKALHPHHVETMIMYLLQVVHEAMKESIQGQRSRGEVLDLMHPSRFDWYFKQYQKWRAEKEKSWKDVPPLFDLSTTLVETTLAVAGLGLG